MKKVYLITLILFSFITNVQSQCESIIPPLAVIISDDQTVTSGDIYWVCEGASITIDGEVSVVYLEMNSTITNNVGSTAIFAKENCIINVHGDGDVAIIKDLSAMVNNSSTNTDLSIVVCNEVVFDYMLAPLNNCPVSTSIDETFDTEIVCRYNKDSERIEIETNSSIQNVSIINMQGQLILNKRSNLVNMQS